MLTKVLLQLSFCFGAFAKLSFHIPNDFDINGKTCPPQVRLNAECPQICVSSIAHCPSDAKPADCPRGTTYCVDGSCKSDCSNTIPVCSCTDNAFMGNPQGFVPQKTAAYPCGNRLRTDVSNSSVLKGDDALYSACTTALNSRLNSTDFSEFRPFLLRCSPDLDRALNMYAHGFVIFYVFLGLEFTILFSHWGLKKIREMRLKSKGGEFAFLTKKKFKNVKKNASKDDYYMNEIELQNLFKNEDRLGMRFRGYQSDFVGGLAHGSIIFSSVFLILLLLLLTLDYYGVFARFQTDEKQFMLFINHDTLSRVFICLWHLTAVWFVYLKLGNSRLLSYFKVQTSLDNAKYVLVEKKRQAPVELVNMGSLVDLVKRIEKVLLKPFISEYEARLVPVKTSTSGRRFIEFECKQYVYDEKSQTFEETEINIGPNFSDFHKHTSGLEEADVEARRELVGSNSISFPREGFIKGIFNEFSGFFYIYQMMCLIIWYYYAYYYMGLVLTFVIVVSGIVKVYVKQVGEKRVLGMLKFEDDIKVKRNGQWITVKSANLVPGDVVQLESGQLLSVDVALVAGGAVADESSLTGEALPVAKFPMRNEEIAFNPADHKVHCLFAGCRVLSVQPQGQSPVVAVVIATGPSTSKGALIKDILYPSPISFVFNYHLKLVFLILIIWGILMLIFSILMLGSSSIDSWFYGMFTISQVLSPLLPAVLVIGQSVATERLRRNGINCVDLQRITLAGKVKIFCFDKTGTLTKEGLEFSGVVLPVNGYFNELMANVDEFPVNIKHAMSTAHSLTMIEDEFVGNFVDVEMFKAIESRISRETSSLVYLKNQPDPIQIVKRFEFVHATAYMTVVVSENNQYKVFMKGSFEKIKDLVDSNSIPADYDQQAKRLASQGYYVLALAESIVDYYDGFMARSELEKNAKFIGFMVFRNELKGDTKAALRELKDGGCRLVMISGDNANTCVYIAKNCGMIAQVEGYEESVVLLGDVNKSNEVQWVNTSSGSQVDWLELDQLIKDGAELAVTGKAFNVLNSKGLMRRYLLNTRIYSRMSPADKLACVGLHMEIAVTGMCGDGGNDASALKASHCGIALTDGESSVVAHFSSSNRSIFTCVRLLREARCSLDVSFSTFKYLIMYGEILAFIGLIQYYFVVNISQAGWILLDGSTIPLSWALTMARPAKKLAFTRPTARLLGVETILSVTGQVLISIIFMVVLVIVLFAQPWLLCNEFDGTQADIRRWWELSDSYEAETTGLLALFQIIHAAAVFNQGSTYRKGWFRNGPFVAIYLGLFTLLSYITLADPNFVGCVFRVNCGTAGSIQKLGYQVPYYTPATFYSNFGHNVLPQDFRWKIWGTAVADLFAVMCFEGLVMLGPVRRYFMRTKPLKRVKLIL